MFTNRCGHESSDGICKTYTTDMTGVLNFIRCKTFELTGPLHILALLVLKISENVLCVKDLAFRMEI